MELQKIINKYSAVEKIKISGMAEDIIDDFKNFMIKMKKAEGSFKKGQEVRLEEIVNDYYKRLNELGACENVSSATAEAFTSESCLEIITLNDKMKKDVEDGFSVMKSFTEEEQRLWRFLRVGMVSGVREVLLRSNEDTNEYTLLLGQKNALADIYLSNLSQHLNNYETIEEEYLDMVNSYTTDVFITPGIITKKPLPDNAVMIKRLNFVEYVKKSFETICSQRVLFLNEEVKVFSTDKNVPCWKYLDLDLVQEGPHSAWDDFLDKFETKRHAELFMEWIWTIFDIESKCHQLLVLQGKANDAKSVIQEVLIHVLGRNGCGGLSDKDLVGDFYASNIWNKRLVSWDETKMKHPLSKPEIHSLVTNGEIQVNVKFKQQFSTKFNGRIWMNTNKEIKINNEDNERRRILYLQLHRPSDEKLKEYCQLNDDGSLYRDEEGRPIFIGDNKYPKRLKEEVYHFLWSCKRIYEERNKGSNVEIPLELQKQMMKSLLNTEELDDAISGAFEFGHDKYETVSNINAFFEYNTPVAKALKDVLFTKDKLHEHLIKKGCNKTKVRHNGGVVHAFKGVRLRKRDNLILEGNLEEYNDFGFTNDLEMQERIRKAQEKTLALEAKINALEDEDEEERVLARLEMLRKGGEK